MRLICPNCDAQYEVDDAVIPPGGRDVQCSNCGHTWFQAAAGEDLAEPEAPDWDSPIPPEMEAGGAAPDTDPDFAEDDWADQDTKAEADTDEMPDMDEEPARTPRRQVLDDALADVLREEAERERQAREAEASGDTLESQPDLGLDETTPAPGNQRQASSQEHVARLRGIEPEDKTAGGTRRDLLPDIEEINYSLRAASERKGQQVIDADGEVEPRKGGFGLGFSLMLVLTMLLVILYLFAPLIAEAVPQTKPILIKYVTLADQFRYGLEALVGDIVKQISSLTSE